MLKTAIQFKQLNQNQPGGGGNSFDDILSEAADNFDKQAGQKSPEEIAAEERRKADELEAAKKKELENQGNPLEDNQGKKPDTINNLDDLDPNKEKPKPVEGSNDALGDFVDSIDELIDDDPLRNKDKSPEELLRIEQIAKLKQYEELEPHIKGDPIIEAYIEFKKSGKVGFQDFIQSIAGEDISNLDEADLFRYAIKNFDEETDEEIIEEKVAEYMSMPDRLRNREKQDILDAYNKVKAEKINAYKIDLRSQQQIEIQHKKDAHIELDNLLKKVEGKAYLGLVITPEMNQQIKKEIVSNFAYYDLKHGYKIKESYEYHFFRLFNKKVIEVNSNLQRNEGREEVIKKVVKPSDSSIPAHTSLSTTAAEDADYRKAADDYMKERGG